MKRPGAFVGIARRLGAAPPVRLAIVQRAEKSALCEAINTGLKTRDAKRAAALAAAMARAHSSRGIAISRATSIEYQAASINKVRK